MAEYSVCVWELQSALLSRLPLRAKTLTISGLINPLCNGLSRSVARLEVHTHQDRVRIVFVNVLQRGGHLVCVSGDYSIIV